MVTAVALLLLLNDKCKPELLQRVGRPGWRFPQTAGCKARTCFVDPYIMIVQPSSSRVNSVRELYCCWLLSGELMPRIALASVVQGDAVNCNIRLSFNVQWIDLLMEHMA